MANSLTCFVVEFQHSFFGEWFDHRFIPEESLNVFSTLDAARWFAERTMEDNNRLRRLIDKKEHRPLSWSVQGLPHRTGTFEEWIAKTPVGVWHVYQCPAPRYPQGQPNYLG